MKPSLFHLPALVLGLLAAAASEAHHSFPAQYDIDKPITLTVTVSKVEWTNPHIFIYGEVSEGERSGTAWAFEMGGPNTLLRKGWKRDSLKPADVVVIEGSLARDGSNLVNARSVTLQATGRKLFAGSSGGDEVPTAGQKPSTPP
ncbi:MAG: DUF6152 family protein [Pseudohongiellaceae bacterium]|jgi:Family of unknown function (DUF6152)